ncbi:hypothetical protein ACHAW5_007110 [Stephanodiscus triporus]|uniref:4a-hydroxytetrahydrobiopterin dehydratase n=1 Tax=Stephanodiscus triporus TaxID=2934178 RepID=A0ABD3P2I0_9STRA
MNLQSLLIFISATSSATLIQAFRSYFSSPSCVRHRIMAETKEVATACGVKCVPCESLDKSHLLSAEQIQAELTSMKLWCRKDGNKISRSFTSRNFQCALDSLVAIGRIAERENHHPDMHLTGYRDVEIVLFTHSLDGISANDIALAKMIDTEVTFVYSQQWLKKHPEANS